MTDEDTQRTERPEHEVVQRVVADRYALVGEIGRGGMGIVWRAEDRVIGRLVAIKELRLPDGAADAGVFQERVLREVRSGGRLNDPAVVTVYDVIAENDTTFIVMELVEAPTLSELVERNGPLPAAQVGAIGDQLLAALLAAHEAGIVHRDVKPGNIMVAANGRVKLTDFGIAQAVDDPRLTTSGMLVGSPAFMAPERVAGRETLPQSDLWSLGATLYYAVEGAVAFERPTTAATLHAIMNEVPYLTHARGPLASAIMGLLIAAPEARISADQARRLLSVAAPSDMSRALPTTPAQATHTAQYPGQPPTMGAPGTRMGGAGQFPHRAPRKSRRALFVTCGAILGVSLLVAGFFVGKVWETEEPDEAMQPTLTYGTGAGDVDFSYTSTYECYNGRLESGYRIGSESNIECEKAHDFEVFDTASSYGDSVSSTEKPNVNYPGDRLKGWAEARCAMSFYSNLVPTNRRGELAYRALVPSSQSWTVGSGSSASTESSGRSVYCVLTNRGGTQLTGQIAPGAE